MVHTSATSAGLQQSLDLLAPEGTVVDLSWYGDAEVRLSLGDPSTPRVSASGPARSARSPWRRAGAAPGPNGSRFLDLLRDPAFDALISGASRFDELPDVMSRLAAGTLPALCHTVTYGEG